MFQVVLQKESLVFSAAHFITFQGDTCERLHGHNYGVSVELDGPLDENHYVFDFIALRDTAARLTQQLDHHVLLPTTHPLIRVERAGEEVCATFRDRRWIFPADDCVLLPIANTTAELLAQYLGMELIRELGLGTRVPLHRLRVGVDENHQQWAYWIRDFLERAAFS